MGVLEPLSILIGIVGVSFIVYAFTTMRLLSRMAGLISIGAIVIVTTLLGHQVFSSEFWQSPELLPGLDNPWAKVSPAQTGWQDAPYVVFDLLLAELGTVGDSTDDEGIQSGWQELPYVFSILLLPEIGNLRDPASPSVPIVPTPPSPRPTILPTPVTPSPLPSPTPTLVPSISPSPDLPDAAQSPFPSPLPSPTFPSPVEPFPSPSPSPSLIPSPTPSLTPSPMPSTSPAVPAWW